MFHRLLGQHELRLGRADRAIEHYLLAYDLLDTLPQEMPDAERLETVFDLGVAYMRHGETRNCAQRHTADSCIFPVGGAGVPPVPEP